MLGTLTFYFHNTHCSSFTGASAQPILEPLLLVFWPCGMLGFPWTVTLKTYKIAFNFVLIISGYEAKNEYS